MNELTGEHYRVIAAEVLAALLPLLPPDTTTPRCVVTQFHGDKGPVHVQILSVNPPIHIITKITWKVFGGVAGIFDPRLQEHYQTAAKSLARKWKRYPQPKIEVPLLGSGVES